jgi:hypothetical protein
MNFSLLCQVSEAQDQLHLSRHLRVHNIQLPDPFKMNVLNDFTHSRFLAPLVCLIYLIISYITRQNMTHIVRILMCVLYAS